MQVRKESEFEFVLGNRQLFSVLAIIVLLLGVFFAMGFFAGRSVGQATAKTEDNQRRAADNPPIVVETLPKTEPGAEPIAPPPAAANPDTQPREQTAAETPAPKAEPKAQPERTAEKPAPPAPEPKRHTSEHNPDSVVVPPPGSYLQVAATTLAQAQAMGSLLRGSDLPTVLAKSTKEGLVRVLVGPFASAEASNAARAKLKSLGVDKPYTVKY